MKTKTSIPPDAAIVGVDIGEKFLDLAIIEPGCGVVKFDEIDLREMRANVVRTIKEEIVRRIPDTAGHAIAIIDSPRCPRYSTRSDDGNPAPQRAIDRELREIVAKVNDARASDHRVVLSMYPTPPLSYFQNPGIYSPGREYLRSIATEVLESADHRPFSRSRADESADKRNRGGMLFTRFMLVGFAAHRAFENAAAETWEGFPYLSFALWRENRETLPPKSRMAIALKARCNILNRIASAAELEIDWGEKRSVKRTLDRADAAVLALTAASARSQGSLAEISADGEGRFLLAMKSEDAQAAFSKQDYQDKAVT